MAKSKAIKKSKKAEKVPEPLHPRRQAAEDQIEEMFANGEYIAEDCKVKGGKPRPPTLFADGLDGAIIAVATIEDCPIVIYDEELAIMCFANDNECSYESAREFYEFNTLRALPYFGKYAPIFIRTIKVPKEMPESCLLCKKTQRAVCDDIKNFEKACSVVEDCTTCQEYTEEDEK
jgi:hypothetical protein